MPRAGSDARAGRMMRGPAFRGLQSPCRAGAPTPEGRTASGGHRPRPRGAYTRHRPGPPPGTGAAAAGQAFCVAL